MLVCSGKRRFFQERPPIFLILLFSRHHLIFGEHESQAEKLSRKVSSDRHVFRELGREETIEFRPMFRESALEGFINE